MKYPKLWNGPSPVGEALVRALQRTNSPWLTSMAGGVTAAKNANLSEVFQGVPDGIYTLGYEDASRPDEFTLRATDSFQKAFVSRGRWGRGKFTLSGIVAAGDGTGFVPEALAPPSAAVYRTRYGRSFKPVVSFQYAGDQFSTTGWVVLPTGRLSDGAASYGVLALGARLVGGLGERFGVWIYSLDRGESFDLTAFTLGPGWLHGLPAGSTTAPGEVFAIVPTYLRHNENHDDTDVFDNHDPYLSFMVRINGGNWVAVDGGELLAFAYPPDPPTGTFDALNARLQLRIQHMQGGRLLDGRVMYVTTPYLHDRQFDASGVTIPDPNLDASLAVFIGTEAGGFVRTANVALPYPIAIGVVQHIIWVGEYGGLILHPNPDFAPGASPVLVVFDGAGAHVATRTIPLPAARVSPLALALDETTLCVPAYGERNGVAAYRLYRTQDLGVTWEPWTTISKTAPPPSEDDVALNNYAVVSWLRDGLLPANLSPGAPWRSDAREPPPWEL